MRVKDAAPQVGVSVPRMYALLYQIADDVFPDRKKSSRWDLTQDVVNRIIELRGGPGRLHNGGRHRRDG